MGERLAMTAMNCRMFLKVVRRRRRRNLLKHSAACLGMPDPLCFRFRSLLEEGAFKALGLDQGAYLPAFEAIDHAWNALVPERGSHYFLCAARSLARILDSPAAWERTGCVLAESTMRVYGNGSHQFIENLVPALIESGLATNEETLLRGVTNALAAIQGRARGEHAYGLLAARMVRGHITSLDEITTQRFSPGERFDEAMLDQH